MPNNGPRINGLIPRYIDADTVEITPGFYIFDDNYKVELTSSKRVSLSEDLVIDQSESASRWYNVYLCTNEGEELKFFFCEANNLSAVLENKFKYIRRIGIVRNAEDLNILAYSPGGPWRTYST